MPKPLVLIADDHEVARTLLAHAVAMAGFEVMAVSDGAAALEAARTARPSLMLLDVHMPVMDGFEVLRRMKSDDDLNGVSVIMLTASGISTDVIEALEIGAADYITKPFNPAELVARMRRISRTLASTQPPAAVRAAG